MKNSAKKILSFFLAAFMLIPQGTVFAADSTETVEHEQPQKTDDSSSEADLTYEVVGEQTIDSGSFGDDFTWTVEGDPSLGYDYTLTVSGTGDMPEEEAPWLEYASDTSSLIFEGDITSISNEAFLSFSEIETVELPDTVTSIGDNAFAGSWMLETVKLSESLTSIGDYAFAACENLTGFTSTDNTTVSSLDVIENLTTIGSYSFAYCNSLADVTIPSSVTSVGDMAFYACEGLEEVTVLSYDAEFGEDVFADTPDTFKLYCKDGSTAQTYASENGYTSEIYEIIASGTCGDNLTWTLYDDGELVISGTGAMTNWIGSTFTPWYSNTSKISTVIIGDGVTTIGGHAFSNYYTNLKSVHIGSGVETIGDYAFYICDGITSVTIPDSVKTIGAFAFACSDNIAKVVLGNSVETIGEGAFDTCIGLNGITLPDSVKTIGANAFKMCDSFTSVEIGTNVENIGNMTFAYCENLTKVTILSETVTFGDDVFYFPPTTFEIHGYTGSTAETYANENGHTFVALEEPRTIIASGTCGDNLTWTLYDDGELVISGTGAMYDWSSDAPIDRPWYSYRERIKALTIKDGVTNIGGDAFYDCNSLTSVDIGDSVTTIGNYAFCYCTSLTSVEIPDSVTTIGVNAFSNCTSLTSVVIPDSVTTIGGSAFYYCTSLTSVDIPDSVTTIGNYAFYYCTSLTSVDIGDSVTTIGGDAFSYCESLTSIDIPDSVTTIGNYAFYNCTSLTSVVIPDSVTSIGNYAFYYCTSLTSVDIPDSVTTIGAYAFLNCKSLTKATILSEAVTFGSDVFKYTPSTFELHGYTGSTAETYANANGHTFVPLDERTIIASGTCGDNLTWTLYDDGELVIDGTGAMTNWTYSSKAPWWSYRTQIETVTIESGVTSIGGYAFYDCISLTSVDIPDSVTTIDYSAFSSCTSLASVDIPDSVTTIGNSAFYYCTSLASVDIPDNVTTIDDNAFYDCISLTSVDIPDSVTTIGNSAFAYCTSLASVEIPTRVTSIDDKAFYGCTSLTSITVDENNTEYSSDAYGVLFNKTKTRLIQYPIGNARTTYTIPDSVTTIVYMSFDGCTSLASVVIPDGKRSIGNWAFYNCTSLINMTIYSRDTTFGIDVFYGTPTTFEIHGYTGSTAETYANENGHIFVPLDAYVVSYDANGGAGDVPVDTSSYSAGSNVLVLFDPTPEREGYLFLGWSRNADDTVPEFTEDGTKTLKLDSSVTLYAIWERDISYTLTIKYLFEDGEKAADDKVLTLREGSEYSVVSPEIADFNADTLIVSGVLESDTTVTVTYSPIEMQHIVSIDSVALGSVGYNTPYSSLGLPTYVTAQTSTGKTISLRAIWNSSDYAPLVYGSQTITGTAIASYGYVFDCDNTITATLTVSENTIVAINTMDLGVLPLNTSYEGLGLPSTVGVTIDTGAVYYLPVNWDSYSYDSSVAGRHEIHGEIVLETGFVFASGVENDAVVTFELSELMLGTADIVFLVDTTGSMTDEIRNVKNNINNFADRLEAAGVSVRWALLEYRDITCDGVNSTKIKYCGSSEWFIDVNTYKNAIASLSVSGGGDLAETVVDALKAASLLEERDGATTFHIIVTDADYKVANNYGISSMNEMINQLSSEEIIVSAVTKTSYYNAYRNLTDTTGGILANIDGNFALELLKLVELIEDVVVYGELTKIEIDTQPDQTEYTSGDRFNGKGMKVKAYYSSGATKFIEAYSVYPVGSLQVGDTEVIITYRGKSASVAITVKQSEKPVTGVTASPSEISLEVGDSYTVTATVAPSDAVNKEVYWESSNSNVVTVENGVIKAVGAGEAVVTVTTMDGGYSDSVSVTVTQVIEAEDIFLDVGAVELYVGSEITVTATISPVDATVTADDITWSSDNESIATVCDGVITGVAPGTATVSAKISTVDGVLCANVLVKVIEQQLSGKCGDNLTWTLYDDGELVISGTGAMWDWEVSSDVPWYSYISQIKTVTIENGVTTIGNLAFNNCANLISVDFGNDVITIGKAAFYWCENLTSVIIPDSVTSIGESAFENCRGLVSVDIGDGVIDIENFAFIMCDSLESLTIGNSVENIGEYAFNGCTSLTSIVIPKSVKNIDYGAVRICTNLTKATIYSRDAVFGSDVFYDTPSTFEIHGYTGSTAETYANENGHIFVPIDEREIIASGTCGDNLTWTLYDDGELVISGTGAMWNFEYLEDYIPDAAVLASFEFTLDGYYEYYCTSPWYLYRNMITSVTIDSGVTSIGDYAFYECNLLASVTIPDGITSIGESAFEYCDSLTRIDIPASVTSIGMGAFKSCESLMGVYITDIRAWCETNFADSYANPIYYAGDLYLNDTLVSDLVIPEITDFEVIKAYAFYGCTSLTSVSMGDNITSIGRNAFSECTELTNVTMGKEIKSIGSSAFSSCTKLAKAEIYSETAKFGIRIFNGASADFEIHGYFGSTSETYAKENGHTFVMLDPAPEKFELAGVTMTLGSSLSLDFAIDTSKLTGTDNYAKLTIVYADGRPSETVTVPQSEWTQFSSTLYTASFRGMSAKQMNDVVSAVFYNAKGQALTFEKSDSIETYAVRMLNGSAASNAKLRTVYVDMLNYGAAAQQQFNYDKANLANKNLTATQKAWASSTVYTANKRVSGTGYVGTTLTLGDEIQLDLVFNNSVVGSDYSQLYAIATYTDHYGNSKEIRIEGSDFIPYSSTLCQVSIAGMTVADFRSVVNCTVYAADGTALANASDSIESYASRNATSIGNVAAAIVKFCDSSYTYFHGKTKCVITFDANGGDVSETTRTVLYGAEIGELPIPTRGNYSFVGWYTLDGTAVSEITRVEELSAMTLTAKWKWDGIVVFDNLRDLDIGEMYVDVWVDGIHKKAVSITQVGSKVISILNVVQFANLIGDPTWQQYGGVWAANGDGEEFALLEQITKDESDENLEAYGLTKLGKDVLGTDSDSGDLVFKSGISTVPTYNYKLFCDKDTVFYFIDTTTDDNATVGEIDVHVYTGAPVEASITFDADTVIYTDRLGIDGFANAIIVFDAVETLGFGNDPTFTVSFNLNYEDAPVNTTASVTPGGTVTEPAEPTRTGYSFAGWFTDDVEGDFENPYDFSLPVEADIELFAKWIEMSDADGDGLVAGLEDYYGTDATDADTDGDDLNDYTEIFVLGTDPLKVDSDANGINDGDEDMDDDGLSNLDEINYATDPTDPDSDDDELYDGDEIALRTDPNDPDTDDDGASDGMEVLLGTDPLDQQGSFDVELTTYNEDDTVTPSVQITLSGEQVDSLRIEAVDDDAFFPEDMPGYMGKAYDFSVDGEFDSATISFEFDSASLDADADPVIYYFNEADQTLEALETTVIGNVASAVVTHFSKYILVDRKVYEDTFTWVDDWEQSDATFTDVEIVFVIDDSGSMTYNDSSNQRLTVARTLIDSLPANSQIGLVTFNNTTTRALTSALTSDRTNVKNYLTTTYFKSSGGTDMYNGIQKAFPLFESTEDTTLKLIVVLSDGATGDTGLHSTVVSQANNANVRVYTVGLGSSTSYFTDYLKPLATNTGAQFYLASNASELEDIYSEIGDKIDIETDSDNDGVPDYYEDNMIIFNGISLVLDKNNPDTDGDGILDGEEVIITKEYSADGTKVKVTGKLVLGNPTKIDTDGDGFTDDIDPTPLVADAFKDFDAYKNWKYGNSTVVTVFVNQPVEGSRDVVNTAASDNHFGNTFVGIDYVGGAEYAEFTTLQPFNSVPRADQWIRIVDASILSTNGRYGIYNNSVSYDAASCDVKANEWNIAYSFVISDSDIGALDEYCANYAERFSIVHKNSATFVIEFLKELGIKLNTKKARFTHSQLTIPSSSRGYSSADLGEDIRENYSDYITFDDIVLKDGSKATCVRVGAN